MVAEPSPSFILATLVCDGLTPISNPGSAIFIQDKRFPLTWKELRTPVPTWRELLPESKCPSEMPNHPEDWVFKPIFGRVGADVAIHGITEPRVCKEVLRDVKRHPNDYVAQRRFKIMPLETDGGRRYVCLGVFTVDGKAAGVYGRIAQEPLIDQDAQDIAVLITREGPRNHE